MIHVIYIWIAGPFYYNCDHKTKTTDNAERTDAVKESVTTLHHNDRCGLVHSVQKNRFEP